MGAPSVLLLALACEGPSGTYAYLDAPEELPAGTPAGEDVLERSKTAALPKVDPSKCGERTGRLPDGTCIRLRVRETPHVQQVQIPSGTFVMGKIPEDYNALPGSEQPAIRWSGQPPRPVPVASFWIDLHEVTRGAYAACVEKGACTPISCPEGVVDPVADQAPEVAAVFPQTCVTHAQAKTYCEAQGHRLPSEAEWEFAARGVDVRRFAWGSEVEDRIPEGLYPAGRMRLDQSYFNILGMSSNALEWVADSYAPESALRPFLRADFRDPKGPVAQARADFERRIYCGDQPAADCRAKSSPRHVIKSVVIGARRAFRDDWPPHLPERELEGWPTDRVIDQLGFRCAADVEPDPENPLLTVPKSAPMVPLVRTSGALEVFGGVAEAVSRKEAEAFCQALSVPLAGSVLGDWRLPDEAEVTAIADVFRGPGPFWTRDGAVTQHVDGESSVDDEAPWRAVSYPANTALAARCVRPANAPAEPVESAEPVEGTATEQTSEAGEKVVPARKDADTKSSAEDSGEDGAEPAQSKSESATPKRPPKKPPVWNPPADEAKATPEPTPQPGEGSEASQQDADAKPATDNNAGAPAEPPPPDPEL